MALLVTIGNICILGDFQLGIWGRLGMSLVSFRLNGGGTA